MTTKHDHMTTDRGQQSEYANVHICRVDGETRPTARKRRRFWCFKCRKRLLHQHMGFYPSGMSYYDPHFWWECPQCREENVLFPGREWK